MHYPEWKTACQIILSGPLLPNSLKQKLNNLMAFVESKTILYLENTNVYAENSKSDSLTNST